MSDFNPSVPFTMTTIILLFVFAIFAMKYVSQYLGARAQAAKASEADQKVDALEKRVAHMEALLKEVE